MTVKHCKTISSLVYTLCLVKNPVPSKPNFLQINETVGFVATQIRHMPDFLRFGFAVILFIFNFWSLLTQGNLFFHLAHEKRRDYLERWRNAPLNFQRQFHRLIESLTTLNYYSYNPGNPIKKNNSSPLSPHLYPQATHNKEIIHVQCCVIGSGPGGSVTAATLAEHGKEVLILEEGPASNVHAYPAFSLEEMIHKYRHCGVTAALGKPSIAYAEGRCLGGGSEINSGLYHRTPLAILQRWKDEFGLEEAGFDSLEPHFIACEKRLSVGKMSKNIPLASLKLAEGADKLGWKAIEVPRWFSYSGEKDQLDMPLGTKQSMTETFLQDFRKFGGKILTHVYVEHLQKKGSSWVVTAKLIAPDKDVSHIKIIAEDVFIACGTIQTPALLQRSGLSKLAGNTFQLHPTVKMTAQFNEKINFATTGVPVHQVKEFSPRLSFGCSISTLPHLALSLLDYPETLKTLSDYWQNMAIYYAMTSPAGVGRIRVLPGMKAPIVTYALEKEDYLNLREGLAKLAKLLQEAGAINLFPNVLGGMQKWTDNFSNNQLSLMTIHLFSSCPMGENRKRCVVNSFGKLHNHNNLYIVDGSTLPSAPGVNPQGSIIAFARRNALHYLKG